MARAAQTMDTTSTLASTGSDMIYGYMHIPPLILGQAGMCRIMSSCIVLDLKFKHIRCDNSRSQFHIRTTPQRNCRSLNQQHPRSNNLRSNCQIDLDFASRSINRDLVKSPILLFRRPNTP